MKTLATWIGALSICATLNLTGCASSAKPAEHWQAYSTTAMAITGDVQFSPEKIVFEDGSRLRLQFLRTADIDTESGLRQADIYRIVSPRPLRLLRDNLFCNPMATHLAVIRDGGWPGTASAGAYNDRRLYVYDRDPGVKPASLCAIYNYAKDR